MEKIKRAIVSCYDKRGVVEFAQVLREFDVEIVSTANTRQALLDGVVEAMPIADFTGVPEMLDGRVKSLHPKIHAGLLAIRDKKLHVEQMQAHEFKWIDMVVVNLHPVVELMRQPRITPEEVVEQIDIGGTALVRSAAKNFRYVAIVVNPDRYKAVIHEMRAHDGGLSYATRYRLAQEAFASIAQYDKTIADYLSSTQPSEE
ncbi:MAG TPA: IMP cyclohydrolase [Candidatus Hydrogenedentes bacterium]|nr:IMP cyclohydrolase [Candidatus Hydrogenedentota bacterium]HIJ72968.1 IMP cyclohydrolase [Candidatus Hydrogenedentota bacterium]